MIDQGADAALTDPDNANFNLGNIQIAITPTVDATEDSLSFDPGNVTLAGTTDGSNVTVGGQIIGTLDGDIDTGNTLAVDFNSDATIARIQTLIRSITYENVDELTPTTGARTVQITVDDGSGAGNSTSVSNNMTVTVSPPAGPTLDSAAWVGDGNGNITGVYVEFSEDVDIVDGNGATAGFDAFSFSAGGYTFDDTDYTTSSAISNLTFTLATPITGTAGPVADLIYDDAFTSSIISDATAQEMDDMEQEAIDDAAEPVMISASTYDQDANGQIDSLLVTFSETIDQSTVQSNGDDFTVAGYNPTAADTDTGTDDADVYILLDELTSPDTDATPLITLNSPTITDVASPAILALNGDNITPSDDAPPVIVEAATDDTNGDGFIETVVLTFSEPIDDDAAGSDLDLINVDGYSGESPDSDNDDDDEVTITFTPQSSPNYDTDATPNIILPVGAVEDGFDNAVGAIQTFTGTEDGAGPAFIDISLATNNTYVDIDLSEGIYTSDATNPVVASNFNISLSGGTGTAASPIITDITQRDDNDDAANATTVAAGDSEIRVWFSYTGAANGETLTIEPDDDNGPATPMVDSETNEANATQAGNTTVTLNLLTIPQIVSSTWLDQNSDGSIDAVEVRFDIDVNIVDQGNNNVFNNFDINGDIGGSSAQSGVITAGNPFTLTFTPADKGTTGTTNITGLTLSYERGGTNDKIRSVADNSEVVDEFVSLSYIDEAAPFFVDISASGDGGNSVFGGSETIIIDVDLGETGLTVTGDLSGLGFYSAVEPFNDNTDGTYTFSTAPFPASVFNNGTINIPITAEDAAGNDDTDTSLNIDIDSEAPVISIDNLFTTNDNSSGALSIELTGTIDRSSDNTGQITLNIDQGTPGAFSSGAAFGNAGWDLTGNDWTLDLNAAGDGTFGIGEYDVTIDVIDGEGNTDSRVFPNILTVAPTAPNSGTILNVAYCDEDAFVVGDIAALNNANYKWYSDAALTTLERDGLVTAAGDIGLDMSTPGTYTYYVTDDAGTSDIESAATVVNIVVNANPVVDAGTTLGTVCSGESIDLGGAPTASSGTGSYVYAWSAISDLTDFNGEDGLTGQTSSANPVITIPNNINAASLPANNTDLEVITYEVSVTSGICSVSDQVSFTVRPEIAPIIIDEPGNSVYGENTPAFELLTNPAAERPFTEGVIQGSYVSYNTTNMYYEFSPQDAGVGLYDIDYIYTDDNGCVETSTLSLTVTSTGSAAIDGLPETSGSEPGVCLNDGDRSVTLGAAFVNYFDLDPDTRFAGLAYYDYSDACRFDVGNRLVTANDNGTPSYFSDDTFTYNPETHATIQGFTGSGSYVLVMYEQTPLGVPNGVYCYQAFNLFDIYDLPGLSIVEDVDDFDNFDDDYTTLSGQYCESDGILYVSGFVDGFGETANGTYTIERLAPTTSAAVPFNPAVTGIDLANPVGAGAEAGTYRITFTNEDTDDTNDCVTSTTVDFEILATPVAHQLNLAGSTKGIDSFDADPNSGVDYTFNYCVDESSFEVLRVLGVDADERVTWYDESFGVLGTSTADGSKISGSELFATASAFPPDPDVYTFYYNITDFIGVPAGFAGCEGDFTQIQINVYPEVVNPPIDLTASTRGEDKSTGSAENYYVFEYCVGETVEDLAVVQDNLTENFEGGSVPTGWSGTNISSAGMGLAFGSSSNAIRLNTGLLTTEVVTADYQSIQRISFYYRTVAAGGTGANILVEVSGDEGDYAFNLPLTNSTTYELFEADVLGSLTNADITISVDGTGDEDMIIDDFSVASTIPNKTFYQWFDESNTPIAVSATGGVSASATELLGSTTPAVGNYTFYVNKIENINSVDTPNFDGCVGESTRIDIIVYSIPSAPTGFDTDINAHSGELNINTRILSTALVDVPGNANVDYIWSATDAIGATDSINSLAAFPTGTINNADLTYGQLLSNLSSPIADPTGYYTVSSTYNGSAYLFQVTNELNRQTSVFPGCGSATGTQVDFTIYPLAEKPILSDTNDVAKTNLFFDNNGTAGDLTDDIGENLELNFCAGDLSALDSISVVSRYSSGNDQKFTWYRSNGIDVGVNPGGQKIAEIAISDSDGSRATASELFLTGITSDLTTYYLVSQTTDIESGTYDGGESDSVRLKVNIFNIPAAPRSVVKNVALQDSTDFYYCVGEAVQSLVVEENGESVGDAEFFWYRSEEDALAGINRLNGGASSATLTPANMVPNELAFNGSSVTNLAGSPAAGTYTFYATQRTNFSESPETNFVSPTFVGCEGEPIEFTIYIRAIPDTPILSQSELFICEDENSPSFSITNRATGALVTWYEDDMSTILKSELENAFDPDDPSDGGITLTVGTAPNQFYVAQRTDSLINGSQFVGCVSPQASAQVTEYRDPAGPDLSYIGSPVLMGGDTVGICETNTGAINFGVTAGAGNTGTVFNWYQADDAGTVTNTTPVFSTTGTTEGSDLKLLTADDGLRFFKVSQIENINAGVFDGCESEEADRTFVKVAIFDTPIEPTVDAGQTNYITSGTVTNYYMTYDSAQFYDDQLNGGAFDFVGANVNAVDDVATTTIDESGVLTNEATISYGWTYDATYYESTDGTAALSDLDLLGTVGNVLPGDPVSANPTGSDNPTNTEVFTFTVAQSQFKDQWLNPDDCDGPAATVNINILPVPAKPTPASVLVELCEDETVGSLSITNRAPGAQVHWFNEDPRVNPNADTLNSIADFTYVPTEVEGNDGTYTYYVRQVTNVEIGGTNFQGAVSDVEIVTVTVYPNAGIPESTAEDNKYIYCLGETVQNLQVDNPENGVTYAWYGDVNLNSFLGNTTSNNNNLIPSLNGAFDENTVGTYNYYVTSTLAGQGCESNPTLVQVIINGLPDPEIKFDTGIAFENEEDVPEFYQICVDESPLSIIGSSEGSSFGTFTGDGVVQGTNGRATFDPLLALGIADPLDMPEFAVDTIMVNYNLANTNDCDDNFQVGFVVTALPRPNFEASISSPINVPVLVEDEDLGVACLDVDPNNLATVTRLTLRASAGRRTGEFILRNSLRDTTLAIANGSVEFDLDLWSNPSRTQDTLFIRYVFADAFGCSYFKDKKIVLHENPMVEFENIVGCIGEPATFTARALAPFNNHDIEFWDWTLINNQTGQIAETTSFADGSQSIVTTISDPSTYRVSVRGRSANYEPINNLATCVSIDESTTNSSTPDVDEERDEVGNTQLVPIGDFPEVDFSWQFITENEVTTVEGKETGLEDLKDVKGEPLNGVSQVWMDWGDGTAIDTLLAFEGIREAFGFANHTYTANGWYDAKLKISTINGCVDSVTKVIKILPHIVVDPALGIINNFEAGTQSEAGWFVDETEMGSVSDKTTSWTYGPIDGSIAQNGFAGSQGWSTDEGGAGYQEDDGSWVFSPSYDISAFEKPMVVFKGHYEFAQNDGAIMEYSVDNGASWNILGRYISGDEEGTGIYWYGTLDIRADPGDQRFEGNLANASGWGFPSAMIDGQGEGFVSSIRHKLDEIPVNGRQNVRFRFHFAATSANGAPGIVFDDFAIVERGRISLIEQFSNSNSNQDRGGFVQGQYTSLALNNEVNARLDSTLLNNNDLVAVNYYTEIYGNDPLFEVNEEGPSARTLFYGLNNVTSILDGDVLEGTNLSTEAASPPWSGAESNRNTLRDAEFDLQLVLNSSDNDEISVTVEVAPQKDFVGNDIRVYLAVVEKVLTGEVLPNGEFDPRNVFRKFLPSPLGHEVNDLNEGSVTTLTETWKIDARKVLDPDQLAVVAFVQKANGDREVYQAARVDINGKTSILGVGDLIEVDDLNLYPNPANDAFFVTFDLTLEEDFQWRLFDQTGRLMKNGQVFKGMDGFRVESAGLPSGLYLMSIGNETKQYTHLKVIVKH